MFSVAEAAHAILFMPFNVPVKKAGEKLERIQWWDIKIIRTKKTWTRIRG